MPRWLILALSVLLALGLVPLALVARARVTRSRQPRIHLIRDMDNQPRFKSQQANPLFADRRAMRLPVPGTVPRGAPDPDDVLHTGKRDGAWVTELPVPVTLPLLKRGRERFGIFCSPCHGLSGHGDGIVARRADRLQEGTWVPPASFHTEPVLSRPVGHIFRTITYGVRNMPAYGPQIPVRDRWAIVAYVRALQRSQNARLEDVPKNLRDKLR